MNVARLFMLQKKGKKTFVLFRPGNFQSILSLGRYRPFSETPVKKAELSMHNHSFVNQNQIIYIDLLWLTLAERFFCRLSWSFGIYRLSDEAFRSVYRLA